MLKSEGRTDDVPVTGTEEWPLVGAMLRWNAVCDESCMHGVEQGKIWIHKEKTHRERREVLYALEET